MEKAGSVRERNGIAARLSEHFLDKSHRVAYLSKKASIEVSVERHRRFITAQAKIFKALGHPSRLLMVDALRQGEKCVCELQELVGDDMSTVSRHLTVLREAGVVSAEKRGVNIYCTLSLCCLDTFLSCAEQLIESRAKAQLDMLPDS